MKYSIQLVPAVSRYDFISDYPALRMTRYECYISFDKYYIHAAESLPQRIFLLFDRKCIISSFTFYIRDVLKIRISAATV